MLTQTEIDQAAAAVTDADTTGLRRQCMCCKRDLPGSNPTALRVSHGLCKPLCAESLASGWGAYRKESNS